VHRDRGGLVIAIDGPSGSGKSTVSRELAARLGLRYLDTGAMYRAVTAAVLAAGIDPAAADRVASFVPALALDISTDTAAARVAVDGRDVTAEIRGPAVTEAVSAVSATPAVRSAMVGAQRAIIGSGGIVVEGRDIGTAVAPDADLKVFLTAAAATRAARRALETEAPVAATAADLARRDQLDATRAASPLAQAPDALVLDSTDLDPDAIVDRIVAALDPAAGASSAPSDPTTTAAGGER
jgi:cytidylate kinase